MDESYGRGDLMPTAQEVAKALLEQLVSQAADSTGDSIKLVSKYGIPIVLTLPLPIDPETLNRAIQAISNPGEVDFPIYRGSYLIPAGTTSTATFYARPGFVATVGSAWNVYSSYYDEDGDKILIWIYVNDNIKITKEENPIPLTGALQIPFYQYYTGLYNAVVKVENSSPKDILLTVDVQLGLIQKSLWEEFYMPMIRFGWSNLLDVASKLGGRKT